MPRVIDSAEYLLVIPAKAGTASRMGPRFRGDDEGTCHLA